MCNGTVIIESPSAKQKENAMIALSALLGVMVLLFVVLLWHWNKRGKELKTKFPVPIAVAREARQQPAD